MYNVPTKENLLFVKKYIFFIINKNDVHWKDRCLHKFLKDSNKKKVEKYDENGWNAWHYIGALAATVKIGQAHPDIFEIWDADVVVRQLFFHIYQFITIR